VALLLGTVVLFRMKRERYAWVTLAPAAWLLVCTLTAGWQKIFSADTKVGFLSHARRYADALAQGQLLAPAKTPEAMSRIVFNDRLDAALCALFMFVVVSVLVYAVRAIRAARAANRPTAQETPYAPMPAAMPEAAR
jgi:carbon starvation protein